MDVVATSLGGGGPTLPLWGGGDVGVWCTCTGGLVCGCWVWGACWVGLARFGGGGVLVWRWWVGDWFGGMGVLESCYCFCVVESFLECCSEFEFVVEFVDGER